MRLTRNPTVGIDINERRLLDILESDRLNLVRHSELLKNKNDLKESHSQSEEEANTNGGV